MRLAEVRKFVVALTGFCVTLATALYGADLIPVEYVKWVLCLIAVAASYGVYAVENADPLPEQKLYIKVPTKQVTVVKTNGQSKTLEVSSIFDEDY